MSENSANIKDRILQLADLKEDSKQIFFRKTGLKYSNFTSKSKNSDLGSKFIAEILAIYPDVNLEWLITGKQKIEKEKENLAMEEPYNYEKNYKDKYIEVLEENRQLNKKLVRFMESNSNLKKDNKQISN